MSKTIVSGVTADEERAFYHLQNAEVQHCTFDGEKDGESALKEGRRLTVSDCRKLAFAVNCDAAVSVCLRRVYEFNL